MGTESTTPTPEQIAETLELLAEKGKLTEAQLIKEAELQERIAKAVGDVQKVNEQQLIIEQQRLKQLNAIFQDIALNNKEGKEHTAIQQAALDELKATYGEMALDQEGINKLMAKNSESLSIAQNQGKAYRQTWESVATHIGLSTKGAAGLIVKMTSLGEELKDNAEKQKEFALAFKSTFSGINLAASIFTSFAESMAKNLIALDQTAAKFAAATGAGRGFTGVIQEAQANSRRFNVSLEEAGAATTALYNNLIGFNSANKATQTGLVETTSQLSKFGIDGATATNVLNFFSANLGKSAEESGQLTKELAMMGTQAGISSAKMTKDFQSALPTLAVYGDRAVDVFQGIAGSARLAGVETSKMLDLANKFDTFSGGAETAGKLNAILGTQISSMELLRMEEDERIRSLIESTQATGVAFGEMDRFTQKAVAASVGITDLAEANRIFGMSLSEFDKQQETMDKSAAVQEEFNKALDATVQLKEKFMLLFARFVPIITPVLTLLHDFTNELGDLIDKMSPETQRLVGMLAIGVTGLVVALSMLAPLITTLSGLASGLGLISTAAPVAASSLGGLGAGLAALGNAIAVPKIAAGLILITALIGGLAYAYSLYAEQTTKQEEAKARQVEGNVALAESFGEISNNLNTLSMSSFDKPIAGLQLMAQALNAIGNDVSVDAKAVLTNLALITVGKAADSANNARIVAAGATQISNNISNSFAPKLVLEVNGTQMDAYVKGVAIDAANANG